MYPFQVLFEVWHKITMALKQQSATSRIEFHKISLLGYQDNHLTLSYFIKHKHNSSSYRITIFFLL